jgi:TrmH family RNA methyltransferase
VGLECRELVLDPADPESGGLQTLAERSGITPLLAVPRVIDAISTLATPQGAVGIFERPVSAVSLVLAAIDEAGPPVLTVLHGLQDPTNAGSLIRSALAAGLSGVLSTEGTVDLFHPRAVRASMGASFRIPVVCDLPAHQTWEILHQGGYRILALDPSGDVLLQNLELESPTALLLGREGEGLDANARRICETTVRIPMAAGVDSLGVAAAGAIAFYALKTKAQGGA